MIENLPDIDSLKLLSQSLAMLDAILSPEWEYRYYSFNSKWAEDQMVASMRNGEGDSYFILFDSNGAIIKGFDHESPMSPHANESNQVWPGVLDNVPDVFQHFLSEPAFVIEETTFCIWRREGDPTWMKGDIVYPDTHDPDGSCWLLAILDGNPEKYRKFAEAYYEKDIPLVAVEQIYNHQPLTEEIITSLNEDIQMEELMLDINEIGWRSNLY